MDSAQKRNFEAIIDEVLYVKPELIEILQKEKNYIILPDEIVGYGNIEVPYSLFNSKNYFKTRFVAHILPFSSFKS